MMLCRRQWLVDLRRPLALWASAAAGGATGLALPGWADAQTRIFYDNAHQGNPQGSPHSASVAAHGTDTGTGAGPDLSVSSPDRVGQISQVDYSALGRMPGAVTAPSVADFWSAPRTIWLVRRMGRTDQRGSATSLSTQAAQDSNGSQGTQVLRTVWWSNGRVIPEAYRDISLFLGDLRMLARIDAAQRQGQRLPPDWHHAVWISPVVLDTLYALTSWLSYFGMDRPIEITSAFRHPLTNAAIEGAARDSLHQRGAAVDVVIPGVPATKVAEFGAWMRGGGVGVYPERGFTHLDAGAIRSWRGGGR
jgi:hypothetical protein